MALTLARLGRPPRALPRLLLGALALCAPLACAPALAAQDPAALVRDVLRSAPLVDGHNDLAWAIRRDPVASGDLAKYDLRARTRGRTDIERLRRGRVGGQIWSVYVPCGGSPAAVDRRVREQIALARAIVTRHPEAFGLALDAGEIERVFAEGRIASLLGVEGADLLGGSTEPLRELRELGVRAVALTHRCTNDVADAGTDRPRHGGLSAFGVQVVRELNRLGLLVDLAHAAPATMRDALDVSGAPVVWTHAAARGLVDHPRNVPDDVLARLPVNGGLVMVAFVPSFVSRAHRAWEIRAGTERARLERQLGPGDPRVRAALSEWMRSDPPPAATISDVADHIEHVRRVAGLDHVGIGADFEGSPRAVRGLEDVSTYPALFAELARRGWTRAELAALAGGNFLRVLRRVEREAARLGRGPTG